MDRPSTISLSRSMRESGYPMMDIAYLDWCGLFMTNDHLAMRIWDLQGQLKCVHHSKEENEYKLIKLCPIPAVQKVMGIYTRKGDECSVSSSKIKLFSEMLTVVQEIELSLPIIEKVLICPDNRGLIVIDNTKTISILYVDLPESKFDKFFASQRQNLSKPPRPDPSILIKLRNIQQIDCSELSMIDLLALDNNVLFVLTPVSILVLTRPKLEKDEEKVDVESMLKKSPKRRKSCIEETPESLAKKEEEAKYPFHEYSHTATLRISYENDIRKPQMISKIDKHLISLVYDDGFIDIIQFSTYLTYRFPEKRQSLQNLYETMVVTSFHASINSTTGLPKLMNKTKVAEKRTKVAIKNVIPAGQCNTYGSEGYSGEFFTVDQNFRIVHWGLRPLSLYSDAFDGYSLASTSMVPSQANDDASVKSGFSSIASMVGNMNDVKINTNGDPNSDGKTSEPYIETLDLTHIHYIALQQPQTQRMLPDFLGDVQLDDEAKVNPSVAKSKPGYGLVHLSFIELRNSDNKPVSKHLVGSYDGMIMLFDIRHPCFTVREWSSATGKKTTKKLSIEDARLHDLPNTIFQAVRGPDLSSIDGHFISEGEAVLDPKGGVSTLLLMKKEQLELVSMKDGSTLRSYQLHNLREQMQQKTYLEQFQQGSGSKTAKALKKSITRGRIADDSANTALEKDMEGEVSYVHFCPYTHWIFVGYTSGTVGAFSMNEDGVRDVDLGFSYLKTNAVHSNSISYIRSFPFLYNYLPVTDHLDPIKPKNITVLFVGDASGLFTLWQIYPRRSDQRALCFQSHQHMGRICSATVCYVPHGKITHNFSSAAKNKFHEVNSNHNILITACEKGIVHAWRMEQNLKLYLISYFHASRLPFRMTSCLALPKMIYREFLVPNPDAPESMFSSLLEDPNKDRNPEFQGAAATKVTLEDNNGRKTAASTYLQKDISAFIPLANLCYEVYCVLGFSDGKTEIWSLSSDPRYCASNSLFSRKLIESPIASLTLYNPDIYDGIPHEPASSIMHEFTLINLPKLDGEVISDLPYQLKPDDTIITAHRNGSIVVSRLQVNPLFSEEEYIRVRDTDDFSKRFFVETLVYFQAPQNSLVNVIPLQPNHVPVGISDYDIAIVSDFAVYEVLPVVSKNQLIPLQWHQNEGRLAEEYEQGGKRRRPYHTTRLSTEDILSLRSNSFFSVGDNSTLNNDENSFKELANRIKSSNQIDIVMEQRAILKRVRTSSTASMLQLTDATPTTVQEALRDMLDKPGSVRGNATKSIANENLAGSISSAGTGSLETFNQQQADSEIPGGNNNAINRRQYVGPMETMQRIVSSDLHIAKKDKRLLELFTFEMDPRESSVTADTAVDIISQWAHENRPKILKNLPQISETSTELDVRRENLQELFHMLEVNPDTRLKFIEVAKIAAITASAMRKAAEINSQKLHAKNNTAAKAGGLSTSASAPALPGYQQMKTTVTKVTYNAMGERVVEKKKREKDVMGLVDGSYTELRKNIYDQVALQKKIDADVKASMNQVAKIPRKLEKIPDIFQEIIQPQRIPLRTSPDDPDPSHWTEDGLHFFDVSRAVKIARSILDMRCTKQHELLQNEKCAQSLFGANPQAIDSVPKLTITYFERLFGECSRSMNVSRYKISNFLEACMQYEYFPVLKLLQYMNQLDIEYANSPGFQVGIWLVVEARNILFSRGSILQGESIDKYEKLTIRDEYAKENDPKLLTSTNVLGDPSSKVIRFQYVTPLEANMVADELLRERGGFGPDFYIPILEQIAAIPTKSRQQCLYGAMQVDYDMENTVGNQAGVENIVREEDKLMDLEGFLEELFRLFVVHVATVKSLDNRLFREANLNVAITAFPREINGVQAQSRMLIMDDDAAGFGSFHGSNIGKIRRFLHLCIQHDPMRVGTIEEEELMQYCRSLFLAPHPLLDDETTVSKLKLHEDQEEEDKIALLRFLRAMRSRVKLSSVQEDASYVDFLALLFTWEETTQGMSPMTIDTMLPIIPTLERLVEIPLINDLIRYVTKASKYDDIIDNPCWIMLSHKSANPYFAITKDSHQGPHEAKEIDAHTNKPALSLPMDGEWHMNVKPAENDHLPGQLYTAPAPRIPYHSHTLSAVKRLQHRTPYTTISWFTKEPLPMPPQVISNRREMNSVLGETVCLHATVKVPVNIRINTLNDALEKVAVVSKTLTSSVTANVKDEYHAVDRNLRTSYSRLLNSMQVVPVQTSSMSPHTMSPPLSSPGFDLPYDAGLEKIHDYLLHELYLDKETASAAMAMIVEQFHTQPNQAMVSQDWQRKLWALLTSQPIPLDNNNGLLRPRAISLDDSIPGGAREDIGEAALIEQSLSELLLQGSSMAGSDVILSSAENGHNQRKPLTSGNAYSENAQEEDSEDDLDGKDLPYKLLRQNSSNSTDSNYQEYALELNQQSNRIKPDHTNKDVELDASMMSQDSGMQPLPPVTRRPVTNEIAALTPFLDFKESDFPPPISQDNLNNNFLMSSSLQELMQFQSGSHMSSSQALIYPQDANHNQYHHLASQSLVSSSLNFQGTQSLSEMNRSLASEEIHRRILHLQELEEKFAEMYEKEKDDFKKREIEKQRLREMIRREMLLKERESMKYYRKALAKRSKFLAAGRAQLADALAKEMEDKKQKENEIQRILEMNRSRLQDRQNQKNMEALALLQKEKEEKERDMMRKEEKLSMKIETVYREDRRRQLAVEKAQADAEWAEQMKSVQEMASALHQESVGEALSEEEAALLSHGRKIKSRGGENDEEEENDGDDEEEKKEEAEGRTGKKSSLFSSLMLDVQGEDDEEEEEEVEEGDAEEEEENDEDGGDEIAVSTADNTRPSTSMAAAAMHFFKSADGDVDAEEELTPIEKRIRLLLANMKNGTQSLLTHPRKAEHSKQAFFFPQMFAGDIVFNPFENISDDLAQKFVSPEVPYVDPSELNAVEVIFDPFTMAAPIETDLFADINTAVKKYRKELDVERRSLLNTKLGDIKLEEFLPVYRTGYVDWAQFFRVEKKRLKALKQRMIAAAEQEAKAFDFDPDDFSAMLQQQQEQENGSSASGKDSSLLMDMSIDDVSSSILGPNFHSNNSRTLRRKCTAPFGLLAEDNLAALVEDDEVSQLQPHIPKTIMQVLPKDPKREIIPLPFGKVKEKQVVFPGQLKFYQMEVPYLDTIVTVELKCARGLASMYLHFNKLPSTVKFEEKANCTKENNRWARLTFSPKVTGSYFLAVTSLDAGAEYEIWAYSTGESSQVNPHLQQVDQVLKKWKFILQHSDEELQIHYPRINQEAKQQTETLFKEQEKVMQLKKHVIREMQKIKDDNKLEEILNKPPALPHDMEPRDEEEKEDMIAEMENVEAFVVKVGRYAMRREREMKQYKQMLLMKSNQANTTISLASNSQDSQDSQRSMSMKKAESGGGGIIDPGLETLPSTSNKAYDKFDNPLQKNIILPNGKSNDNNIEHNSNVLAATGDGDGLVPDALQPGTRESEDEGVFADENPNQHADLFSTPTSHRVASMAMFAPVPYIDIPPAMVSAGIARTSSGHHHHSIHVSHPYSQPYASTPLHHNTPMHQQTRHRSLPIPSSHLEANTPQHGVGHHTGNNSGVSSGNTSVHGGILYGGSHSYPAASELLSASKDTFEQELQRVMSEEIAVSQEKAAAQNNFSLPALNLKYKGSDLQFEKDFHVPSKMPTPHAANNAHNLSSASTPTANSQIPKLPPILQALRDRLADTTVVEDDENASVHSTTHEEMKQDRGDVVSNTATNAQEKSTTEMEDKEEEAEENRRVQALILSATMPHLQQDHAKHVHDEAAGDAPAMSRSMQYSFSAADIRENKRREKMRLKMLPPELRAMPKPVSYALRMDQQIPEKWTHTPGTIGKRKGLNTGSSLELGK